MRPPAPASLRWRKARAGRGARARGTAPALTADTARRQPPAGAHPVWTANGSTVPARRRHRAGTASPFAEIGRSPARDRFTEASGHLPTGPAGGKSVISMTEPEGGRSDQPTQLQDVRRPRSTAGTGVIPRFRGVGRAVRDIEDARGGCCPGCSGTRCARRATGRHLEPISTRNPTDLEPEVNRSRRRGARGQAQARTAHLVRLAPRRDQSSRVIRPGPSLGRGLPALVNAVERGRAAMVHKRESP